MGDGVAEPAGSCRGRKKNPLLTVESMVECSVLSAYEVETVVVNWVAVGVPCVFESDKKYNHMVVQRDRVKRRMKSTNAA